MLVSAQTIQLIRGKRACVRLFRGPGDRLRSIQINDLATLAGHAGGEGLRVRSTRVGFPYTWRYLPWHSC
jgi:hypothetical protein